MNILIVTPHFHPENFRINDLALELKKRNHNLIILTSVPNYPDGKFFEGYGIIERSIEVYNGIKIYRCPVIPRGSGALWKLSLNYVSYVFGACFKILFIHEKIDVIFVYQSSPITIGLAAIMLKKIRRVSINFWVLDLWPDSVLAATDLKNKIIPSLLLPIVKYIYSQCDKISVTSRGYIQSICAKGVDISKIEYVPQWAENLFTKSNCHELHNKENEFNIMFAGNIGEAQDFRSILDAASDLEGISKIKWTFIGSGSKYNWVKKQIKERKLTKCCSLIGRFPLSEMPKYFSKATVMLIALKKKEIFRLTVPGKLQAYMAMGKPILGMIDGQCREIIDDAKAGLTCGAEDSVGLVKLIKNMNDMTKNDLIKMGLNSRKYYQENFDRKMIIDQIELTLNKLAYK